MPMSEKQFASPHAHPVKVDGLVLLNSAGPIDEGFTMAKWEEQARTKGAPPKWLVKVGGWGGGVHAERVEQ